MALVLRVAGTKFEGWTSVALARGLDRMCSSFQLSVTDRPWNIRPGMACDISIDGELMLTGYVDRVGDNLSGSGHILQVEGRSKCGDLVDCSAEFAGGQFDGLQLIQIARALARPFDVTASATAEGRAGAAGVFDTVKLNPGETVQEVLQRLARYQGILLSDDAEGNLVLTARSSQRAGVQISEGQFISAEGRFSAQARYSRYTVVGQRPSLDFTTELEAAQVKGEAVDEGIAGARHRPLIMTASAPLTPALASRLARHEAAVRFGRSAEVAVRVRDWRERPGDAASALWAPNRIVRFVSPSLALERDMLVSAVSFGFAQEGLVTDLSLVRPEAYDAEPPPLQGGEGDDYAAIKTAVEQGRGNV